MNGVFFCMGFFVGAMFMWATAPVVSYIWKIRRNRLRRF